MTLKNFNQSGIQGFAVSGNWSPSGIPGSSDDAEINDSAFVSSTADETVNSIGLGTNNVLNIQNASAFTTNAGTGPNANNGLIVLAGLSSLEVAGGTFDNPGTIELTGSSASNVAKLLFSGSPVTLSGGGTIEMSIGGGLRANFIGSYNSFATPVLTNQDNTISGDGTIGGGIDFTNDGTIETNNSTSSHGGTIDIGTVTNPPMAPIGFFTNDGTVRADDGGTVIFGQDGIGESFTNDGSIDVGSTGDLTKLEISGNVTIYGILAGGVINLGGSGAQAGDEIVSDGKAATLTIIKQTLKGAGTIGDSNLTIDNASGTIDADLSGQEMSLGAGPGAPLFSNGGTLEATSGGILSAVNSPIANTGNITALSGGNVLLGSVLSTGSIDIGAGSSITLTSELIGNVSFTGDNAKLIIANALADGGIDGEILGAVATDSIDITSAATPYSASNHLSWQQTSAGGGVLSLINGSGQTIEAINLAGTFTSANFTMAADGPAGPGQGTLIEVINPPPPAATTADMIMADTSGDYEIYDLGNNTILAGYGLGETPTSWQVAGLGQFAGTDTSDIMLRSGAGAFEVEDVSNNNVTATVTIGQVGMEWTVAGFGDFSGNPAETDMLLRNSNNGKFEVYDISNNSITNAAAMGQVGLEWQVAGFGDFSGKAGETADMLLRNGNTGAFEIYDISNNSITNAAPMGQVGLEWQVTGFGDFSGKANETDMVMRNSNTGAFEIYDIANNQVASAAAIGQVGMEWQVVGFGPINSAGAADMVMRNSSTGAFEIYDIANNQITNAAPMGQVGLEWSVSGIAADPPPVPPAQLVQAMASYAPAGGALDTASPPELSSAPLNPAGVPGVLNPGTAHPNA
jgi:hypothetical protein